MSYTIIYNVYFTYITSLCIYDMYRYSYISMSAGNTSSQCAGLIQTFPSQCTIAYSSMNITEHGQVDP